jgi:hypothetical protein
MDSCRVIIMAGLPDRPDYSVPNGHPYPLLTSDIVKLLRQQGLEVDYEHQPADRIAVSLNALELWLPILNFVGDVGANVPANIVANLITSYFRGSRLKQDNTVLHLEIRISSKKKELKASGRPEDVLAAVERFGKLGC